MTKLGRQPASRRISASIDDVVVLPCEPATAIVRRVAASAASAAARCSTGMPALARRDQLGVAERDRGRVHDGVGVGRHVLGAVADVHVDTGRGQAREHRRVLDVGAAHPVTHAREQRARSRSSRRRRHRRCGPCAARARSRTGTRRHAHGRAPVRRSSRACSSTRSARRAAASGGPSRARGRRHRRRADPASASSSDTTASRRAASHSASGTTTAAPARASVCALRVWWSLGAPGQRHEHRGHAGRGELGDRARAGPAHRERRPREQTPACAARSRRARSQARRRLGAARSSSAAHSSTLRGPHTWCTATSSRSRQRS